MYADTSNGVKIPLKGYKYPSILASFASANRRTRCIMKLNSLHIRERADGSFGIFDAEVGQIGPSFISREAAEAMLPRPQPAPVSATLRPAAGGGAAEGPVERP